MPPVRPKVPKGLRGTLVCFLASDALSLGIGYPGSSQSTYTTEHQSRHSARETWEIQSESTSWKQSSRELSRTKQIKQQKLSAEISKKNRNIIFTMPQLLQIKKKWGRGGEKESKRPAKPMMAEKLPRKDQYFEAKRKKTKTLLVRAKLQSHLLVFRNLMALRGVSGQWGHSSAIPERWPEHLGF